MEWATQISWPDLLVIIILLRSTYVGSQRGLFGELFHILGLCLAIIFGIHFYATISYFFSKYLFLPANMANILGFVLIAALLYLLLKVTYGLLQKAVKIEVFPAINRIAGPVLGLFKGFVLSIFLFFIMLLIPIRYISDSAKTRSFFAPFFGNKGVALYKKSAGMFSSVRSKELERLLAGAEPLKFDVLRLKRKDRLDDVLK